MLQLGDIGDVVLSFPAMRALRENFPNAKLVVAVREKAAELVADCPWTTAVLSINTEPRKWYQELAYQKDFFLRLWRHNLDLVIDLRTGTRGAVLTLLSGARQRIGFYAQDGKLWRNRCYSHLVSPPENKPNLPNLHVVQYYLSLLFSFNIKTENVWPEFSIPPDKRKFVDILFKENKIPVDRPVIAVQPFSLWQYKEWGQDNYIQLINWIGSAYKLPVVITGSLDERQRSEKIVKMCNNYAYNLAGMTSIGMYAAVLGACSLFISGDSAGLHIAAAVGTPTVSIFGPTSSATWAPRGEQHTIVQKKFTCVPCREKGCQGQEISRCLEELTFDEVSENVAKQLSFIT